MKKNRQKSKKISSNQLINHSTILKPTNEQASLSLPYEARHRSHDNDDQDPSDYNPQHDVQRLAAPRLAALRDSGGGAPGGRSDRGTPPRLRTGGAEGPARNLAVM